MSVATSASVASAVAVAPVAIASAPITVASASAPVASASAPISVASPFAFASGLRYGLGRRDGALLHQPECSGARSGVP